MHLLIEWLKRKFCISIDLCDENGNIFRTKTLHCDYYHKLFFDKDMKLIRFESEKKNRKKI